MSLPISSIGLRYRNALRSACSASLYSPNALSIAFASSGVMIDDITPQPTASRQIEQRLRSCRRNRFDATDALYKQPPSKERDEVIEQESLIRCAGYGSFGVGLSDLLMNGANRLIGIGRMVVVLCSLEISFIVCKKRSCRAIGCAEIIDAACTSFCAA
jgi:hypothetical protein